MNLRAVRKRRPFLVLLGLLFVGIAFFRVTHGRSTYYASDVQEDWTHGEAGISQAEFNHQANLMLADEGIETPLMLQTNEQWADLPYGDDGKGNIAENGCALMSLAMVLSYWRHTSVDLEEILDWAQNDYFVDGQGTDWRIFSDFAKQYQLDFHDLGSNITAAEPYLSQGIPVIASVTAGQFTDSGHILVISELVDGTVRVLDPNDSPEKNHYSNYYTLNEIQAESLHFWTYTLPKTNI